MHLYASVSIAVFILHALVTHAGEIRKDLRNARNIALSIIVFIVATLPLLIVAVNLFLKLTSSAPDHPVCGGSTSSI